jgi:hypothetical protein
MTTAHLRAEGRSVMDEAGGELTTRAALLIGAAEWIERLEKECHWWRKMVESHQNVMRRQMEELEKQLES